MPNMKSIINSHSYKILRSNVPHKTCNCKIDTTCFCNGQCLLKGVYKVTIYSGNEIKECIGSTGVYFKARCTQHKHSIKSGNSSQTTLSKYIRKSNNGDVKIIESIINKILKGVPEKN